MRWPRRTPRALSAAEAIEQGAGLSTRTPLPDHRRGAAKPVAENEMASLTDMGYPATDLTKERLLDGLARVEDLSAGPGEGRPRHGQKAVFQMNATLAKQILRQLTGG